MLVSLSAMYGLTAGQQEYSERAAHHFGILELSRLQTTGTLIEPGAC